MKAPSDLWTGLDKGDHLGIEYPGAVFEEVADECKRRARHLIETYLQLETMQLAGLFVSRVLPGLRAVRPHQLLEVLTRDIIDAIQNYMLWHVMKSAHGIASERAGYSSDEVKQALREFVWNTIPRDLKIVEKESGASSKTIVEMHKGRRRVSPFLMRCIFEAECRIHNVNGSGVMIAMADIVKSTR